MSETYTTDGRNMSPRIKTTEDAVRFLVGWMRENFIQDRTFTRYIETRLATDFAFQLAHAILAAPRASAEQIYQIRAEQHRMSYRQALDDAAKVCEEYGDMTGAEKDSALLVGKVDLSNAMSGEPRAARFLREAILALSIAPHNANVSMDRTKIDTSPGHVDGVDGSITKAKCGECLGTGSAEGSGGALIPCLACRPRTAITNGAK